MFLSSFQQSDINVISTILDYSFNKLYLWQLRKVIWIPRDEILQIELYNPKWVNEGYIFLIDLYDNYLLYFVIQDEYEKP